MCPYSNIEKSNKRGIPSSWSVVVSPTYRTTQDFLTTIPNLDTLSNMGPNLKQGPISPMCVQVSCARAENKMSFNMRNPRVCSRLNISDSFPSAADRFCCDLCIWAATVFHMCCIWSVLGTHWGAAPASASWGGGSHDPLTNDPGPCSATKDSTYDIDLVLCA